MRVQTSLTRRKLWLPLGFEMQSNQRIDLLLDRLATHLHIVGPPGSGKTRILFWIFQQLCKIRDAAVVLFNVKGALGSMARDWSIAHGYTKRLIWFDPNDEASIIGYNPLQPNHLPAATHAKNVREAIRSAWGQSTFDQTAQLARFLFIALYAVRELTLTLTEALELLRPESAARKALLPRISDPYLRDELAYIDDLRPDRQDVLLAPALARLQSFVLDPTIRRIITQQTRCLTLADALPQNKILIFNFEQYKPWVLDDIKLTTRFIINNLVAHVFSQNPPKTVYLLLDECHIFATADLCRCLDQGRELGLHCVLAHQYLNQLREEEQTGLLADSVMKCARTKLFFGGLSTSDLEVLTPEVTIDRFDPWRVKDELTSLECEPVESTREVVSTGQSKSRTLSRGSEVSQGESKSRTTGTDRTIGRSIGSSRELGASTTHGLTESEAVGYATSHGHMSSHSSARSSGQGSATGRTITTGEAISGDRAGFFAASGDVVKSSSEAISSSASDFHSQTDGFAEGESWSDSEIRTVGRATSITHGRNVSRGRSITNSQSRGRSQSRSHSDQRGQSASVNVGESVGENVSKSITPWYEYRKRRIVSSRQFLNREEQMILSLQKIKSLPKGHFLLKVPDHEAVFVRAPFVKDPWLSQRKRQDAMERIYNQPYYSTPEQIAIEEQERARQLQQLQPQWKAPRIKSSFPPTEYRTKSKAKTDKNKPSPFDGLVDDPTGRE